MDKIIELVSLSEIINIFVPLYLIGCLLVLGGYINSFFNSQPKYNKTFREFLDLLFFNTFFSVIFVLLSWVTIGMQIDQLIRNSNEKLKFIRFEKETPENKMRTPRVYVGKNEPIQVHATQSDYNTKSSGNSSEYQSIPESAKIKKTKEMTKVK